MRSRRDRVGRPYGLGNRIVAIETADKMTDRQIAAIVRARVGG